MFCPIPEKLKIQTYKRRTPTSIRDLDNSQVLYTPH